MAPPLKILTTRLQKQSWEVHA